MADDATERITILLQAKDRDLQRAIERNNKLIAKFERDATKATTASARNIDQNMSKMSTAFAGMAQAGVAAIGVLAASLASGAIRNAITQVADLADTASRIGIDTDSFQGLQRGFQLAGVEADAFGNSLEIFTQRLGEAADGAGPLAKILRQNGIALKDQNGEIRPTLELLNEFADVVNSATSQAEKMALLNDAFGRSGKAMVDAFQGGSAAMQQMINDAIEGGYVLDEEVIQRAAELDDKFDDLTLKAGNFFKGFAVFAGEAAAGWAMLIQDIISIAEGVDDLEMILNNSPRAAALLGAAPVETMSQGNVSEEAVIEAKKIEGAYVDLANAVDNYAITLQRAADEARWLEEEELAVALEGVITRFNNLNTAIEGGTITWQQYEDGLTSATEQAGEALTALNAIDDVEFSSALYGLGSLILKLIDVSAYARQARADLAATQSVTPGTPGSLVTSGLGTAPISPTLQMNTEDPRGNTGNVANAFVPPVVPASTGGGRSGGGGTPSPAEPAYWDELVRSVQEAQDALAAYNDTADAGADKMADLFMSIIDGSKSAKEALADVLMELAKISLQNAFLGMSGAGSPLQPLFAAIGGAFGGMRAEGGPVSSGQSYIVGENGPELFTPGASGMITPNHAISGGSGGVEIIVRSDPGVIVEIASNTADARIRRAAPAIAGQAVAQSGRNMRATKFYGNQR